MAAKEASANGINMTYSPMVDVAKDARWGRIAEGAGEDTLLNARYGAAKVKGYQGDDLTRKDTLLSCMKHFAAYGMVEAGRDYNRVDISRARMLEEILPAFEACVKAGARAVMPAFNDISGVPCSVNRWLMMDILRDKWGVDGVTVNDANAIAECVIHGIAADGADAAGQSLEAGMDVDMASGIFIKYLPALLEEGKVTMDALDRAVADVLRVKFELGLFEDPYIGRICKKRHVADRIPAVGEGSCGKVHGTAEERGRSAIGAWEEIWSCRRTGSTERRDDGDLVYGRAGRKLYQPGGSDACLWRKL